MSAENGSQEVRMQRKMTLIGGVSMLVGSMIGGGLFVFPQVVLRNTLSVWTSLLIWLVGGLVAMAGAMCYAELGTLFSRTGGEYIFIYDGVGAMPAFLKIWVASWVQNPGGIAIGAQACAMYLLAPFFPCGPPIFAVKMLAIIVLASAAFINASGTNFVERSAVAVTAFKLAGCVFLSIVGIIRIIMGNTESLQFDFSETTSDVSNIALAMYGVMFCYDGFSVTCLASEELKNPKRDIPLSIFIGVPFVIFCSVFVNVAYFSVLPRVEIINSNAIAIDWSAAMFGTVASYVACAFVALSIFGTHTLAIYSCARVQLAASRNGQFFRMFAFLNIHNGAPLPSLFLTASLAAFYCLLSINTLLNSYSFILWTTQLLVAVALVRMRYMEKYRRIPRVYAVPLGVAIFYMLMNAYLIVGPLIQSPDIGVLYSVIFILSGLLVYVPFVQMHLRFKTVDKFIKRIERWMQIISQSAAELKR